jgi:hypothetical protein
MVGGVGYVAGKAAANRGVREEPQQQRPPSHEAQPAPAMPPSGGMAGQLEQLGKLRDSGVLTPEEFERAKQKILETDS